jgi:hypothetical protein
VTPQARRMSGAMTAGERENLKAELRREVFSEFQDLLHSGNDLDTIRDRLDEQLEAAEPREIDIGTVRNMSAQEINENWAQVSAVMAASGHPEPQADATPPSEGQRLSWETLRAMPVEEHRRRRHEIDAWIARQA